jgi:hypothetical protein
VTDDYRAHPAINISSLKYMDESPAHCKDAIDNAREVTGAMSMGTAEHCMILEPSQFPPRYTVWTGGVRRGKEWDGFKASNPDKTIITQDEYETCVAMREAVMAHTAAGPIFQFGGEAERALFWTDAVTGIACKCRIDWLCGTLVDLKTTQTANPRRFAATAARYKYHAQMAWYRWGVECALGIVDMPCQLVVVESQRPHDVVVYTLDDLTLAAGWDLCRAWLDRYAECKASGKWPGRYETETTLNLPRWAFDSDDDSADELGLVING